MILIRLRKKIFVFLFTLISISSFATEPKDFSKSFLSEKVEFFYVNPSPYLAKEVISEIAELNALDNYFYFFVALAKEYPKEIIGWFLDAGVAIEMNPKLIHALHFAGLNGEAILLAQKAKWPIQEVLSLGNEIPSFLSISLDFPGYISCMCSHYFVTGDVKYIRRIVDALEATSSLIKDPKTLKALKEEAQADLRAFILKHDRVYQLCLEETKRRKGEAAVFLNNLLEELHQAHKKSFAIWQNKMFNGFIFVTDDSNFEEQWHHLPTMVSPDYKKLEAIPYPSENKLIRVFIMFNGMELDKNLNGHVTYNLEVIDPKGNKLKEFQNKLGINQKISSRFFLQKAEQAIAFEFYVDHNKNEKEEKEIVFPGTYVIRATLKDHISGEDLKLNSTLEVLPKK